MENINIKINKKTRMITELPKSTLGNDGENLQENLVFSFDDEFVNGTARLELLKPDKQKSYIMLEKIGETYQLPVKSVITKTGKLDMQLVITEGSNYEEIPIFKSNKFYLIVNSSINAEIEQPDEYPQWIDVANTKLNEIDEAILETSNLDIDVNKEDNVATITLTDKEGQTKEVEILDGENGENGQDGIGLEYDWDGTLLGIKKQNEQNYKYVDLKGDKGDTGSTGPRGEPGIQGIPGNDGITPTIGNNGNWYLGSEDTGKPSRGIQGQSGTNGQDGFSPTISVTDITGGHRVTITDATGPHSFDVMNGSDATAPVQDVQINNTSILNNGVANIPVSDRDNYGVSKVSGANRGIEMDNGFLQISYASSGYIKGGSDARKPIVPYMQHEASFYGLAKVAGTDLASQSVTLGQYPDETKFAIQKMLGVSQKWELIRSLTTTEDLSQVTIDTDDYGNAFELSKMMVIFQCGQPTTGTRDLFYCQVAGYNNSTETSHTFSTPSLQYVTATSNMSSRVEIDTNKGAPVVIKAIIAVGDGNTQNMQSMVKTLIIDTIKSFKIYQSGSDKSLIPSGATIDLYGIRA